MRRLLIQLLAAALAALVGIQVFGVVWGFALRDRRTLQIEEELLDQKVALAVDRLADIPPSERVAEIDRLQRSLALHLALEPAHVPPSGVVVVTLPDGTRLLGAPRHGPPLHLGWVIVQIGLTVVGFGFAVAWLARPLLRDLGALESAARRLEAGDFTARTGLKDGPVGEVGAQFDTMADQVERMLLDQRRLLQAVSHELRTPQARMRFQLEALADTASEAQKPWVTALDGELEAVDTLLSHILTLQRLQQAPAEPAEPEATREVVEAIAHTMSVLSEVVLDVDVRGTLPISRRDLRSILENLVSNGQRHARSRIRITVVDGELTVEDDGEGVDPSAKSVIFQSFASNDPSRNRQLGGVGLGLALVRRAAARWGAVVTVDRSPTLGGACFRVYWAE
ncbi:MAG: ATP-binding protein [Myxococcota bacterium]